MLRPLSPSPNPRDQLNLSFGQSDHPHPEEAMVRAPSSPPPSPSSGGRGGSTALGRTPSPRPSSGRSSVPTRSGPCLHRQADFPRSPPVPEAEAPRSSSWAVAEPRPYPFLRLSARARVSSPRQAPSFLRRSGPDPSPQRGPPPDRVASAGSGGGQPGFLIGTLPLIRCVILNKFCFSEMVK